MTEPKSIDLVDAYAHALRDYLEGRGEEAMERAYDIGRQFVRSGSGVVELANVHAEVLGRELPAAAGCMGCVRASREAARFLVEGLAPFEMMLRGFQDANAALYELNRTLESRVQERTRELDETREMYQRLVEQSPAIVFTLRGVQQPEVTYISPQIRKVLGYSPEQWSAELWQQRLHPDDRDAVLSMWAELVHGGSGERLDYRILDSAGRVVWLRCEAESDIDPDTGEALIHGILLDVTETRQLQDQLMQTQKLETIGRLAGGIAHDFNNLLSVILSYTRFALGDCEEESPLRSDLEEILGASNRASRLTRQLLAFSRKQVMEPRILSIEKLFDGMDKMLRHLIGDDIQMHISIAPELWRVRADPGQLEQVVMNLVVNAGDAMPHGGEVRISVRNLVEPEVVFDTASEVQPGEYVCVRIADNGSGMDDEVRQHIFEPFYTTKPKGKGTGLGLATCYGIVT